MKKLRLNPQVLVLFALLSVSVALATERSSSIGTGVIESYATDIGVSSEEAARRLQLQDVAGDLGAELALKEWGSFGGLWIQHSPEFRVIVQFTEANDASKKRASYFEEKNLAGVIEVRKVEFTLAQLETTQQLALVAINALNLPGTRVESGINVKDNRVEIYVADRKWFMLTLREAGVRLESSVKIIEVDAFTETGEAATTVNELQEPNSLNCLGSVNAAAVSEIYAGLSLTGCTSGWSVKTGFWPFTTKGVITAGHCGNSQKYNGVSLPFKSEVFSGSCDVQWHDDTTYEAMAKFRVTDLYCPDTRNLTGMKARASQAVGEYVCKYGMTSRFTCGTISDKNFKSSAVPNSAATFIRVKSSGTKLSTLGDSGGPWFNGNTGYGVVHGNTGNDGVYMAIDYVQSCLGVTVFTW